MTSSSLRHFFNNPKNRAIIYQSITIFGFIFFGYFFVNNLFMNIEKRGIATGFDFLSSTAGFEILYTLIDYNGSDSFFRVFLVGLTNTILVSFLAIIFASILGLFVALARLSDNFLISKLAKGYIELFRNIPLLLQIIFWYRIILDFLPHPRNSLSIFDSVYLNLRGLYIPKPIFESNFIWVSITFVVAIAIVIYLAKWSIKRHNETGKEFPIIWASLAILTLLPVLAWFIVPNTISFDTPALRGFNFQGGMSLIPEFMALFLALSIYTATYIAEAIRAGIEAVSKGQREAALSLGLKPHVILRKVILPQALRVAIPPIINQHLNILKNSSLGAAIGYPELVAVFAGTALNQVGRAIEIILMTMTVYLFLSITISLFLNWFNKKFEIKGR